MGSSDLTETDGKKEAIDDDQPYVYMGYIPKKNNALENSHKHSSKPFCLHDIFQNQTHLTRQLTVFLCECACVDTKTSIIDDISGGKYSIYIDICGRLATKTVLWELHLFLKKGQFPVSSGTSLILVPVSVLNGTSLILVPVSVLNGTSLILLPVSGPKVSGMTRVMAMVKSVTWSTNTPKAPRAGVN